MAYGSMLMFRITHANKDRQATVYNWKGRVDGLEKLGLTDNVDS